MRDAAPSHCIHDGLRSCGISEIALHQFGPSGLNRLEKDSGLNQEDILVLVIRYPAVNRILGQTEIPTRENDAAAAREHSDADVFAISIARVKDISENAILAFE